jgi:hypothetical protein
MYGGNIGQMLAQIEAGSGANIVISDKGTLDNVKSGVKFESFQPLGGTALVLAWRKGVKISVARRSGEAGDQIRLLSGSQGGYLWPRGREVPGDVGPRRRGSKTRSRKSPPCRRCSAIWRQAKWTPAL